MDKPTPVFKPVPLQVVLQASAKVQMKAIYRRLQRTVGKFDEEFLVIGDDGLPLWDLTTPLPVERHNDWIKKGFEYVTLADRDSLDKVAPFLAAQDPPLNARDYLQHPHFGAWNPKLYAATAADGDRAAVVQLFALLDQHGVATVEEIRGTKIPAPVIAAWQSRKKTAAAAKTTTVGNTTAVASSVSSNLSSLGAATDGLGQNASDGFPSKPPAAKKSRARKPAAKKAAATPTGVGA